MINYKEDRIQNSVDRSRAKRGMMEYPPPPRLRRTGWNDGTKKTEKAQSKRAHSNLGQKNKLGSLEAGKLGSNIADSSKKKS